MLGAFFPAIPRTLLARNPITFFWKIERARSVGKKFLVTSANFPTWYPLVSRSVGYYLSRVHALSHGSITVDRRANISICVVSNFMNINEHAATLCLSVH